MMRKTLMCLLAAALAAGVVAAQQTDELPATAYGTVNVRGGPGAQYEIVSQLADGDEVTVNGRDSAARWLRVRLEDGKAGWVAVFAVSLERDPAGLPVVDLPATAEPGEAIVVTALGLVNVRGGPGMDYAIVGQMDADTEADVTGRSNAENDWLFIEADDLEGWVAYFTVMLRGDPSSLPVLVIDGSGMAFVPADEVIVARYNVRLRESPSLVAEEVVIVPFGSNVTPLSRDETGEWVYVLYLEVTGWGAARLFDLTPERAAELPLFGADAESTPEATPDAEATAEPEVTAEPTAEATPEG